MSIIVPDVTSPTPTTSSSSAIKLSTIHPDFDQILAQMQQNLSAKLSNGTPVWKDFLSSGTGETISEHIAGIGAFGQYAVESALQENFRSTAKTDSSIRACVIRQGARLSRKIPSVTTVTISRPDGTDSLTIHPYSQFSGEGVFLFNRDAITFNIGETSKSNILLHEGTVVHKNFSGDGSNFQLFVSEEMSFAVSEKDVRVSTQTVSLEVITDGLWNYASPIKNAVEDITESRGRLVLQFGNTIFGYLPTSSDIIYVTYVITNGANGNTTSGTGKNYALYTNADVVAVSTTTLTGGENEVSPSVLKQVPSTYFGNSPGGVIPAQFQSLPLLYPGVKDCLVLAQRDLCLTDVRYMNLLHVALLTTTAWTTSDWNTFIQWYESKTLLSMRYVRIIPTAVSRDVSVTVYVTKLVDPVSIQSLVETAISELFAPKYRMLNTTHYISDIVGACMAVSREIKYVEVALPTATMSVTTTPPAVTATEVDGGTIVGLANYAVSALVGTGETKAITVDIDLDTAKSVKLDWTTVTGATGYNVYGRTTLGMGLIATVANDVFTYTDTGAASITPNGPLIGSTLVKYNSLGSLTVNVNFTDRYF